MMSATTLIAFVSHSGSRAAAKKAPAKKAAAKKK